MKLTIAHSPIRSILATVLILGAVVFTGWLYLKDSSSAADIRNFDPGNIMSDAVMSNKSTMSIQDIQNFLNSKNYCDNRNVHMAAWYPHLQYNIKDGRFVCMARDSFNGKSAAQIIWQVAQDYSINPQFLIVLLEKEQGLITDTWPNHIQYRSATGFGCPDTAPCDSQYFGLENQLRQAANLFRTVLNGGWSNYPVGNTYVQYHPNAACGGSIINIQNRATSALYRYTPYQPNQSALSAGYGTGDSCGAYGNRNTWRLFTDWFGGTTQEVAKYSSMDQPRELVLNKDADKINPITNAAVPGQSIKKGVAVSFSSRINTLPDNRLCLRTTANTTTDWNMCVPYENLSEYTLSPDFLNMEVPRAITTSGPTVKINPMTGETMEDLPGNLSINFRQKTYYNGALCLRTSIDTDLKKMACVLYSNLKE